MAADFKLRAVMEYVDRSAGGIRKTEQGLESMQQSVDAVKTSMIAMGVVGAGKAVFELGRLGAESIRTRHAFDAISGGSQAAAENLAAMQRATRGALSEQQTMAAASRLMQMGLAESAGELEQVSSMAVRLGGAMGKDAAGAMEEFALLLANQSIPRLDTFGISAGKVRTRIGELTSTVAGMTREQAFMQAVMEEGNAAMERLGEATEDELLAFERMEASTQDLKAALGEALAPAVAEVTGALADALVEMNRMRRESDLFVAALSDQQVEQANIIALTHGQTEAFQYLESEYGRLAQVQQEVADADRVLTQRFLEVENAEMRAAEQAAEVRRRQEELPGALEATRGAARLAADTLYDLSTSSSRVADSFGKMKFDNEALWQMAMASGADVEQLAVLAEQLGIATDAEIETSLEAWALVEAFGEGTISAEEFEEGMLDARDGLRHANREMGKTEGQLTNLRGSMERSERAAQSLSRNFEGTAEALEDVEAAAWNTIQMLARIDREIVIRITYEEEEPTGPGLQVGTSYWRGGMALVGERGAELVVLPRGARVFPWSAPETQAVRDARQYHYGGDTVVINDQMAAAMYLENQRRRRIARAEGRM